MRTDVYEGIVQSLIDELGQLPGVGPKGAQRIAFYLLSADPADVRRLASSLLEVLERVKFCRTCGNVAEEDECRICRDPRRGGAQGRRGDREDPRVPRPLPCPRRRDQPDRRDRARRPADLRAYEAA